MRKGNNFKSSNRYRVNEQIASSTLRLLDTDGKQIGIVTKQEALDKARELELDLVEVAPLAQPPVAKIIDFSKFLYQLKKKKQEEKKTSKVSETKQIRLGPFTQDHDLDVKLKKAKEFLEDGDKVKFAVRFAGRAITKQELGRDLLNKVIEKLGEMAKVEREMHMEGRQMIMIVSKGK